MAYRVIIQGRIWARGLTERAAEVIARENRERFPALAIRVEADDHDHS